MIKCFTSREVKDTDITYRIEEIEETGLVKWWATKEIKINDKVESTDKFCGVCEKSFFDDLQTAKLPNPYIEYRKYSNSMWGVVAISKVDMEAIRKGEKLLDDYSVMKRVYFDNIDSDDYDLYLYGGLYSQLLTLDKEIINLPEKITLECYAFVGKFGELLSRLYDYNEVSRKCIELMNLNNNPNCKIISMKGSTLDRKGLQICISLSDEAHRILNSEKSTPTERYDYLLGELLGLTRKNRGG